MGRIEEHSWAPFCELMSAPPAGKGDTKFRVTIHLLVLLVLEERYGPMG